MEAYDVTFGVFNHIQQSHIDNNKLTPAEAKRPLSLVALHPAEDWAGEHTSLERVLKGFADNGVGEVFRISLLEFLALPVEYANRLMRISKKAMEKKTQHVEDQLNEIERQRRPGGHRQ